MLFLKTYSIFKNPKGGLAGIALRVISIDSLQNQRCPPFKVNVASVQLPIG